MCQHINLSCRRDLMLPKAMIQWCSTLKIWVKERFGSMGKALEDIGHLLKLQVETQHNHCKQKHYLNSILKPTLLMFYLLSGIIFLDLFLNLRPTSLFFSRNSVAILALLESKPCPSFAFAAMCLNYIIHQYFQRTRIHMHYFNVHKGETSR